MFGFCSLSRSLSWLTPGSLFSLPASLRFLPSARSPSSSWSPSAHPACSGLFPPLALLAKVSHTHPAPEPCGRVRCGTSPFLSPVSHAHRPENALSRGWLWDTLAKLTDVPLIGPKVPKDHRYGNFGEPTTDCKKKVLQKLGKTAATPHLCK